MLALLSCKSLPFPYVPVNEHPTSLQICWKLRGNNGRPLVCFKCFVYWSFFLKINLNSILFSCIGSKLKKLYLLPLPLVGWPAISTTASHPAKSITLSGDCICHTWHLANNQSARGGSAGSLTNPLLRILSGKPRCKTLDHWRFVEGNGKVLKQTTRFRVIWFRAGKTALPLPLHARGDNAIDLFWSSAYRVPTLNALGEWSVSSSWLIFRFFENVHNNLIRNLLFRQRLPWMTVQPCHTFTQWNGTRRC